MPTAAAETIERFAFEGILSLGAACALGLLIAAVSAWLVWRERQLVGGPTAALFWALRIVAVAVVLWMLLGPTHVTTVRHTRPQSIAVVVDTSESMQVADPNSAADDLRWSLAATGKPSAVGACDRAVVTLRAAAAAGDELVLGVAEHRPRHSLRESTDLASQAASRSAVLLEDAVDGLGASRESLADRAERAIELLNGPIQDAFDRLRDEMSGGDDSTAPLAEAVASLADLLHSARRRAESLSIDAARSGASSLPSSAAALVTRNDRAGALVGALEEGPLQALSSDVRIRRFRFDESVIALSGPAQWDAEAGDLVDREMTPVAYQSNDAEDPYESEAAAVASVQRDDPPPTDLAALLETLAKLRNEAEPLRMAIVLTDGRHNAPDATAPQDVAGRLLDLPVHVVPIGVGKPSRDVRIHRVEAPSTVVENDTVLIEVLVTAFDCRGERLAVTLRRDGEEVDRKTFDVPRDRYDERVTFRVLADSLGWRRYEIEVEPVTDEASLTNNLSAAGFEVVRDKIRVLLADRGPRYEYRYLQNLFRRDEHVDFEEFLTLPEMRATGRLKQTRSLPSTPDDWARYDVVILGDLGREHLTPDRQQALVEYVQKRGGNVIMVAGREHMPGSYRLDPLEEIVPVEEGPPIDGRTPYAVELAEAAQLVSAVQIRDTFAESRQAWESVFRLMPIYGLSRYHRPKPAAETLLYAQPRGLVSANPDAERPALFCWASNGAGRVAYLAAPQSYVLRFRRGDRDHHRFWGQTLRWITAAQVGAGSDRVRLETDRIAYESTQPVEVTVWLNDEQGRPLPEADFTVEARAIDEPVAQIEMRPDGNVAGRYVGVFERLPVGAFDIAPAGPVIGELTKGVEATEYSKLINVQASAGVELFNTQGNRPLLEQIAELTGGQVLPPTAVAEALEMASFDPEVSEESRRTPLWDRWSNLIIVLGCLFTEWIVRKQKGLA